MTVRAASDAGMANVVKTIKAVGIVIEIVCQNIVQIINHGGGLALGSAGQRIGAGLVVRILCVLRGLIFFAVAPASATAATAVFTAGRISCRGVSLGGCASGFRRLIGFLSFGLADFLRFGLSGRRGRIVPGGAFCRFVRNFFGCGQS